MWNEGEIKLYNPRCECEIRSCFHALISYVRDTGQYNVDSWATPIGSPETEARKFLPGTGSSCVSGLAVKYDFSIWGKSRQLGKRVMTIMPFCPMVILGQNLLGAMTYNSRTQT